MHTFVIEFELSTEFLAEIGKMNIQFSILQYQLRVLVKNMIAKNSFGNSLEIVTLELSEKQLVKIAKSLLSERGMINKEVFKKLDDITLERNKIIHSLYVVNKDKEVLRIKDQNRNGKFKRDFNVISKKELDKLIERMTNLSNEIHKLGLEADRKQKENKNSIRTTPF